MSTNTTIPAEHRLLETFYRHHLWANLQLCNSLLTLSEDQLNHSDPGTFGSIWATLRHFVLSEEYYLSRLTGQERASAEHKAQIPIAELREKLQYNGKKLMEVALNVQPDALVEVKDGEESWSMPAVIFLLQAVHHAEEHRTQICTLLGQQGITPPALSGWSYFDAEMN